MGGLRLEFLGDIAVLRDGERLELPPSKKTRALLAYLALNARGFRRERLCELLWEIPDDPRGSLRWSLSKLRRLVDEPTRRRIVADRESVRFDATDVAIDVAELRAFAAEDLERTPLEQLEQAAGRYQGHLLEGLSLSNFHEFDAWCVAERDLATRTQAEILGALLRRLADAPERALPYARRLVRIVPYDESARAGLIGLLVALGHSEQAEQQYHAGSRLLAEAGAKPTGALYRAWKGAAGPAAPAGGGTPRTASASSAGRKEKSAVQPSTSSPQRPGTLVGRDHELAQIRAALDRTVSERRAGLVLVTGQPGIGKSRMLEAAAALAEEAGALLLAARAHESETIRPFALWIDALRAFDRKTAASVFEHAERQNRERLFEALAAVLMEQAPRRPAVLLLDDLQWSDESSAAALHYVVRYGKDQPLLVVAGARDEELRDNRRMRQALRELKAEQLVEEIPLGPLNEQAVRELISQRAAAADGARLSKQCGGNPLLAIELARAEAAGDKANSLGEIVHERLARFDLEGGDVLRWAAVLAPRIDAATLARATGLDWNRIGEALETAARHAMLLPAERGFRFSHDLIAASIYADISPARRRTMHRRVAELLEQDTALDLSHAADLAHHAVQSGDTTLAARALIAAGRLCLRFFANEEALALARKALAAAEQLPAAERIRLILEAREVAFAAAPVEDWQAAAREYAALAEQALDHGALSHARRGYYMASYVRWMHGHSAGAREEMLQAERVARAGNPEEHVIGMAEAARCLALLERDLTQADAMLMEAQTLAARRGMSHHAIPAALGMLRFHENKLDEAAAFFKEAHLLAKACGDRLSEFQANEYLAMIELERGRPEAALPLSAALVELGGKLREGSERPFAAALHALCRYARGEDSAPLDAALDELRSADAKHRLAYTLTRTALLDIELGRYETATARAAEALACAEVLDRASEILLAHVALALARQAACDEPGFSIHRAAMRNLLEAPVAEWARARAAPLVELQ